MLKGREGGQRAEKASTGEEVRRAPGEVREEGLVYRRNGAGARPWT